MATPTYIALATTTLGATASSVTFSSIPATYRDLVLVVNGGNSGDVLCSFNADTGSNYTYVAANGQSAGAVSFSDTRTGAYMGYLTGTTGLGIMHIMDYSASDKHTTTLSRVASAADSLTGMAAARWANTNVVTSVAVTAATGSFNSGSTFSLFGIEA